MCMLMDKVPELGWEAARLYSVWLITHGLCTDLHSRHQPVLVYVLLSWLQGVERKVRHTFLLGNPGPARGLQTERPLRALAGSLFGLCYPAELWE